MSIRPIKRVSQSVPTMEGAGVKLRRAFGFGDTSDFDPFLMMDDFRGDRPEDYLAGFPWHPHRGIETITYVLAGSVDHGDSLGNRGKLGSGDVQWMTAGSGILHQEMPTGDVKGRMHGFQLWANLPAHLKMVKPRYQDVPASAIPEVIDDDGTPCASSAASSGARPVRSTASPPSRAISTSPCRRARRSASRSRISARRSPIFSRALRHSPIRPNRLACCAKRRSTARRSWCATR